MCDYYTQQEINEIDNEIWTKQDEKDELEQRLRELKPWYDNNSNNETNREHLKMEIEALERKIDILTEEIGKLVERRHQLEQQ